MQSVSKFVSQAKKRISMLFESRDQEKEHEYDETVATKQKTPPAESLVHNSENGIVNTTRPKYDLSRPAYNGQGTENRRRNRHQCKSVSGAESVNVQNNYDNRGIADGKGLRKSNVFGKGRDSQPMTSTSGYNQHGSVVGPVVTDGDGKKVGVLRQSNGHNGQLMTSANQRGSVSIEKKDDTDSKRRLSAWQREKQRRKQCSDNNRLSKI